MAPSPKTIADNLHARGLRKKSARRVAEALSGGPRKASPKAVARVADELRRLASDLEERATGKPDKRKAAARKAAATRKANADARSRAAKKAARTRAQKSSRS